MSNSHFSPVNLAARVPQFRKNASINGDFNVWQRGTSFAAIATSTFSADRWRYEVVGTAVHTISRSTDVPTVAEAGRLFNYSLLIDCTTVDSSIAAGDNTYITQPVEGYNWLPLAQRAITLSFWVKGTKTGIHCVALGNSGADRSYVAEYTINTTATWEKKTVTFTASPSAGTWDYTTGIGLRLYFILACGSTYHTTAGAWQTGNFIATSNQVNGTDSTDNDFRICGVQLEAGSVATEFEQRTFNEELALCQRYYEKSFNHATAPAQNAGVFGPFTMSAGKAGAASEIGYTTFKVEKYATPTITFYNPSAANAQFRDVSAAADCTSTLAYQTGSSGFSLNCIGNASTAVGNILSVHWQAVSEL